MGAVSSCCEKDYAEISDTPVDGEGSEFAAVAKDEAHLADEYNQNLSPFTGLMVELKFTSKSGYEEKFVWLNSTSKTIHMSTHSTKEKRHKEASLADVCTTPLLCSIARFYHHPPAPLASNIHRTNL